MRSEQWKLVAGVLGLVLGLSLARVAVGQVPPPAPVPTVWDKLGITGLGKAMQSKLVNPKGNHPGLEKKPLLKQIADPANLDPKMPKAIQAAAAIKQQEDLAPQKIKAIKYLATTGCGCYQKTVDVRGALLEALDDCTEEVRLAAANALEEVAGDPCSQCAGTCCGAEVMNKLQEHACGKDANGCFKETSADVRKAAQAALDACRRKLPPGAAEAPSGPAPLPERTPETAPPILPRTPEAPVPLPNVPHVAPPSEAAPLPPPPSGVESKKSLEVPAEPPKSSAAPLVRPVTSSVAIVAVTPVDYEARTTRPLPLPGRSAGEEPKVVIRLVIPGEK